MTQPQQCMCEGLEETTMELTKHYCILPLVVLKYCFGDVAKPLSN
jgi:hypothetical protein